MIALHMIVSGSEDPRDVERCLKSVEGQVDASFVVITSPTENDELKTTIEKYATVEYKPDEFFHTITKQEVKFLTDFKLKPDFKVGDKIFEFDKARNYAMSMVPKKYDWLLWLDADDILRGKELRSIVEKADLEGLESVFLNYIYQAEIVDGQIKSIEVEHLRERLIKNTDIYEWVAPIHETLIEKRPTKKRDFWECDVLHLSTTQKKQEAISRNINALQYYVARTKAEDPRPVYYLGKAYFDQFLIFKNEEFRNYAEKLFTLYLLGDHKSGWAEERSQCWEYLVEISRDKGQFNNAIKACHNAMIEDERFPSIYINLALCYVMLGQYDRALFWVKIASKLPQPQTTLVFSPKDLANRTLEVIFHAYLNTSQLDEAHAAATKLLEIDPESQMMKDRYNLTSNLKEEREVTKLVSQLAQYLEQSGQGDKLKPLTMAIPTLVKNNPFMVNLIKKVNPPRIWKDNEICIYCGPGFTPWSPKDLEASSQNFIGGSEIAVLQMSKALTNQGWKVTVYADPGADEGEYDGVTYLPYYQFNTQDEFNVLVGWRRVDLADQNCKCKKLYIWCHDVLNQLDFTKERMDKIYKVIVLSPWHRQNIPNVPDEKIMISTNGIELGEVL